jgi:hypothetical protein
LKNLLFLIPVYNDWKSLDLLLKKIDLELKKKNYFSEILIINDASTIIKRINIKNLFNIKNIFILNTKKNLGSQKCIHLALKHINQFKKEYIITIIDSDGEDDPKEINKMINLAIKNNDRIITSNRLARKESLVIRILYRVHLIVTLIITGHWISFGNYTCFNSKNIKKIIKNDDGCYAHPANVIKHSKIIRIFAKRNKRFFDKSKVNFLGLMFHSLRIISVFQKKVFFRSLIIVLFLTICYILLKYKILLILIDIIIFFNLIIVTNKILFQTSEFLQTKNLIKNIGILKFK